MADISITPDWTATQPRHFGPSWPQRLAHRLEVLRRRARRDRRMAALIRRMGAARAADLGIDIGRYRACDWIAALFRNMTRPG